MFGIKKEQIKEILEIEEEKIKRLERELEKAEETKKQFQEIWDILWRFEYLEENHKYLYSSQWYSFMEKDTNIIQDKNGKVFKILGKEAYLKRWGRYTTQEESDEWKIAIIDSPEEAKHVPCQHCNKEHVLIKESSDLGEGFHGKTSYCHKYFIICPQKFDLILFWEEYCPL